MRVKVSYYVPLNFPSSLPVQLKTHTEPNRIVLGLLERNLSLPAGTSNTYAFQQLIGTEVPGAQLKIKVEGFTSTLTCQSAHLNTSYSECDPLGTTTLCWSLDTDQCQFPTPHLRPTDQGNGLVPQYYGTIGLSGCNNSTQVDDLGLYIKPD